MVPAPLCYTLQNDVTFTSSFAWDTVLLRMGRSDWCSHMNIFAKLFIHSSHHVSFNYKTMQWKKKQKHWATLHHPEFRTKNEWINQWLQVMLPQSSWKYFCRVNSDTSDVRLQSSHLIGSSAADTTAASEGDIISHFFWCGFTVEPNWTRPQPCSRCCESTGTCCSSVHVILGLPPSFGMLKCWHLLIRLTQHAAEEARHNNHCADINLLRQNIFHDSKRWGLALQEVQTEGFSEWTLHVLPKKHQINNLFLDVSVWKWMVCVYILCWIHTLWVQSRKDKRRTDWKRLPVCMCVYWSEHQSPLGETCGNWFY